MFTIKASWIAPKTDVLLVSPAAHLLEGLTAHLPLPLATQAQRRSQMCKDKPPL
jgi:hypothetical protein